MHQPRSMRALEDFGRIRLSSNFFMRDFLYSEIAGFYGVPNIPADPALAVAAGERAMPSASRTAAVHLRPAGSPVRLSLGEGDRLRQRPPARARVEANAGYHIWDMHDGQGFMGAAACLVVPWFADRYEKGADWRQLAWWIHDHLPYGHLEFYPKLCAFNIQWSEQPRQRIDSFIQPRGCLTMSGMPNHGADHSVVPGLSAAA